MSNHPFNTYFAKHRHYPRVRIRSGVQTVTVEFAPGYVRIETRPRGATIYITRSAWFALLRRLIPLSRKWKSHPDHDVPLAMHEAYENDVQILHEQRQMKRTRKRDPKVYRRHAGRRT